MALLPLLLPLALGVDLLRPRRLALCRSALMILAWLLAESVGVLVLAGVWLAGGTWAGASPARLLRWTRAVQVGWNAWLVGALRRLFSLRFALSGAEALRPGPYLLLARHVSSADTLVPIVFVALPTGFTLRYVLKRDLLWDPCLDIAGQRLKNAFVARGAGGRDLDAVRGLAEGLGPEEAVVLFPEGTRFSEARRKKLLQSLAERDEQALLDYATSLHSTLPPHPGGVSALLEAAPHLDVIFCAHTGFEGVRSIADLLNGRLVGRRISVHFSRFSLRDIAPGAEARYAWLQQRWAEVDRWVTANSQP